jgi:CRP/FNR family transcriptional regulator, cyclic AMP receptor protein
LRKPSSRPAFHLENTCAPRTHVPMNETSNTPPFSGQSILTVTQLLKGIPDVVKAELLAASKPLAIRQHARLFAHGDPGDAMYIVQQGRIEISIVNQAGRKIVLNQVSVGNCVGEISMIDGQRRTASAEALEHSVVLPVTRAIFMRLAVSCPQLAINLAEMLCERLRWVSASVEEYALFSIDLRLARRLLSLNELFADREGYVAATQSDLAEFVGATRESANKILMQWKADGLILLKRGSFRIQDKARLALIAYSDETG